MITLATLLAAFALVESSNRNLAPYNDGGGTAMGYYGFHAARWHELSNADYRRATKAEQDAAMLAEIAKGLRISRQRGLNPIACVASLHHAGHVTMSDTVYIGKIRRALEAQ